MYCFWFIPVIWVKFNYIREKSFYFQTIHYYYHLKGILGKKRGFLSFKQWFDHNRPTVNISKTKHMVVSLKAVNDNSKYTVEIAPFSAQGNNCLCPIVERVSSFKYLDNRLNYLLFKRLKMSIINCVNVCVCFLCYLL